MRNVPEKCPYCGGKRVNPLSRPFTVLFPDHRFAGGRRVTRIAASGAFKGDTLIEWEYLLVANCNDCNRPIYETSGAEEAEA